MKNQIIWLLLFIFLGTSFAHGQEKKPLVKLNVVEKIDGKKSKRNLAQYMILQFFYIHGFDVLTANPTRYDKKMKVKNFKNFKEWQDSLKNKKADFIIQGEVKVSLGRVSRFYESTVAFIYTGTIQLKVKDSSGKVLATIKDEIEFGTSNRGKRPKSRAAKGCVKYLALFMSHPLYKIKAIKKHIPIHLRGRLEKMLKQFDAKRKTMRKKSKKNKTPKEKKPKDNDGPF